MRAAVLRSADDVTPDTKQAIQPIQIYSKSRNRPTPVSLNVYVCIYRCPITTYYIPLKIYKDKLSNKLHFIRIILDSLKVISEKPQVNQVVPYRKPVGLLWTSMNCYGPRGSFQDSHHNSSTYHHHQPILLLGHNQWN